MKRPCRTFQERFISAWDAGENPDARLTTDAHYPSCQHCQDFVAAFGELEQTYPQQEINPPAPNFHAIRAGVWQEIDRREAKSGVLTSLLRPAILAPVMVILLAVASVWLLQNPDTQTNRAVSDDALYDVAVETLSPEDYPSQTITQLTNNELSTTLESYVLQTEDYESIQELYGTQDDWETILADVSARQL